MKEIEIESIEKSVKENPIVILYFNSSSCGACAIIRKRIGTILMNYPEIQIFDIPEESESKFAADHLVFSYPLLILYVEGKETIRVGKNIDFLEFENVLDRYYQLLY